MKRRFLYGTVCLFVCTFCFQHVLAAGLHGSLRVTETQEPAVSGHQELLNLHVDNGKVSVSGSDYSWTESEVASTGLYPNSSQGYVDMITGQDGNLYCAFYDDRTISGYPYHKSVYVRKSVDGGATWENIDGGATGFALNSLGGLGDFRPSVEVWDTTSGNYRIAVAVSALDEGLESYDVLVLWKELGLNNDWVVDYLGSNTQDYALPRLKAVPRPSNPSRNRLVLAFVGLYAGYYISTYSDNDAASFAGTASTISGIMAWEIWRPDLIFDELNNRLFCVFSMSQDSDPQHLPKVLIACSPDRSQNWYTNLWLASPSGWEACAEAEAALASNPLQTDPTLMIVYSAQQTSTDQFHIHYTFQNLNDITESAGNWDFAPVGHPMYRGTVYTDTNGDNTMPAIWADQRLTGGGYRVAFLDETSASSGRMCYTESAFDMPGVWMIPDEVSAPGADPARQGGNSGVSSGIAIGTGLYAETRAVVWPDYRNGTTADVFCARYPVEGSSPTATPTSAPTPTSVPTPAALPATGPAGAGLLLILVSLAIISGRKK